MDITPFRWTRHPKAYIVQNGRIEVTTRPHTDLWQRTYYHFRNDNAPVFQMETEEKFFSFVVRTDFHGSHTRFDQCGVVMYLDSENWLKASVEYENDDFQNLGSVVTNHGYSDWATTAIPAHQKVMWYRLSRREDDYCVECSEDGQKWRQMPSAISTKGPAECGLASMLVHRKTLSLRQSSRICNSGNVRGKHTRDNRRTINPCGR